MKPKSILLVGIAVIALATLALAALRLTRPQADLRQISGQNVLLVTVDTLRADALGSYGGPAMTPALDQLAVDGVRFDFAHAHSVLTLPSHASILTGTYPFQHGLRDNSGYRLPADARTASTLLKQAGYATGAFVGAFPLHSRFGLNSGFDVYDDRFGEGDASVEFNMPERPATAVVALAREWIAGKAGQKWFTWVHVYDPHAPYRPPPPFDTQYAGRPYYGEIAATDAALAPLLSDVRNSARPTLVIVTSDHGEGLGEHGEQAHGLFAYESTLRIPLIIAELGGAAPHTSFLSRLGFERAEVSSVAARHIDILPTVLDAIGQAIPADLPGRTLLDRGERTAGSAARVTYFESMAGMLNHGWAPLSGVLVGREKFIELPIAERYDLAADPAERVNLAGRSTERDRAMASILTEFKAARPGLRMAESADAAAQLRALGYLTGQAPIKARYSDADDPKKLVELDQAIHHALDAIAEGRVADAEALYRNVIDRRPDMAIAYRHLAFIEWQRGNGDAAVAVLRRAVEHGVTDPRVVSQLGEYLTDLGRVAQGISLLEPLARSADADADTLNALAIAYARAGRSADARRTFERLAILMPAASAPLENLGVLALQDRDLARASAYFDRAAAANPRSWRAQNGLASVAYERGDRAAAYAAWRRALALDPNPAEPINTDALFSLGVNLARDGRLPEARAYLEQFLRTAPPAMDAERREAARLLRKAP